jgi:phage-related protein
MPRPLAEGEKPLDWVGSSKREFMTFPETVRDEMGNALGMAQFGAKHPAAKPWKGQGPGVFELVEHYASDTYRAVYTVRFAEVIYVLLALRDQNSAGRHRSRSASSEGRTTGL